MIEADKKEWSGILVYLECYKGELHTASEELIGEAVRLSEVSKDPVYVAGIGKDMDRIREALDGYPVAKAYLYESEDEYESPLYTKIMAECIEELKPAIVLVGGTYEGRSLAPGLAVRFQTGLTADCTGLAINEEGNLVQSRPAFGGNIMADIVTQFSRPQFATVRPGVMQKVAKNEQNVTEYVNKKVKKESKEIEIISLKAEKSEKGITEAKIVIVAGRGVKKKEDLEMLKELAGLVGGKLASSRALVEKGWMLPKEQIGLSGNTVSPDYMITCGVSGTVQFMAGMKNTKNIIAINEDPKARIFEIAHYPMVGDLYEIVPELIRIIKERRGER